MAENLKQYCKKGSRIAVEGRLATRSYENGEGNTIYVTEVIVDKWENLTPKQDDSTKVVKTTNPFEDMHNQVEQDLYGINDDDLPF